MLKGNNTQMCRLYKNTMSWSGIEKLNNDLDRRKPITGVILSTKVIAKTDQNREIILPDRIETVAIIVQSKTKIINLLEVPFCNILTKTTYINVM